MSDTLVGMRDASAQIEAILLQDLADARKSADRQQFFLRQRIQEALERGIKISAIARASGYTREHIARIRDGKSPKPAA